MSNEAPEFAESVRVINKPWGSELIWAETEFYVGKIIRVDAGAALSLQFHEVKDEVLHLLSGSLSLEIGRSEDELKSIDFKPGMSYRVRPGVLHRITALSDSEILEVSTNHLDDVVRLSDRYGRA